MPYSHNVKSRQRARRINYEMAQRVLESHREAQQAAREAHGERRVEVIYKAPKKRHSLF